MPDDPTTLMSDLESAIGLLIEAEKREMEAHHFTVDRHCKLQQVRHRIAERLKMGEKFIPDKEK